MQLRQRLNHFFSREYTVVFCLCMAMLFCMTYELWFSFDISQSVDPKTYWGLAHFDFEQSMVRKYRVIIPFLVAGLHWILVHLVHLINPNRANGDFPMRLIFYIVNLLCTASWCTLVYAYIRILGLSKIASLVAPLIILVSKWTHILTATFMVDTFFCCFIALTFIGIETKNARLLFWCMMIAPFAKENYMFLLPVIFFFSGIPKWKIILWSALSAAIMFSYRYLYDHLSHHAMKESWDIQSEHFSFFISNSHRFVEDYWQRDMLSTIGFWWLVPLAVGLLTWGFGARLRYKGRLYMWLWALMVVAQMLMSGDLSRMLYLYLPVYCFIIASAIDHFRQYNAHDQQLKPK